jgi:polyhydroxybutyrate depolymerase
MRHSKCAAGSEVTLFTVEGGGHTWPGGKKYLPERFIGKTSQDLDASQEIWTFFSRHRSEATNAVE